MKRALIAGVLLLAQVALSAAEQPLTFVPMGIGTNAKTEDVVSMILGIHERSGISRFMLHGPGHVVRISGYYDEKGYREVGRRAKAIKDAVAAKGIQVGFLMGPTMNVGINHPWTKFVMENGKERPFTACPGDPDFRKAFALHCAAVAEECRPFLYMMEDDFRLFFGHRCYCHRHQANPEQAMEDLVSLATEAAKAIHRVSPETRIGLSAPGGYREEAARLAQALADGGRPFIRWYGTEYGFDTPMNMPGFLWNTIWSRQNLSDGMECVYEADACPNTCFYGSGTRLVASCSAMLANGFDGLWYWIGNNEPAKKFGEIPQPNLEAYTRAKKNLAAVGACGREGRPVGIVARTASGGRLMARYGFPYRTCGDGVKLYCGKDAFAGLGKDEIEKILSGRVFLDGDAAIVLTEMGLGELTGVKAFERSGAVDFCGERVCADGSTITSTFHQNYGLDDCPVYRLETAGAEEVSQYFGGPDGHRVQSAVTRFVNAKGGRVVTIAVSLPGCTATNMLNYRKRQLMLDQLKWLGGEDVLPVRTDTAVNVMLFANEDEAKSRLFVHATQLSCDPADSLSLIVATSYRGGRVEILKDGKWEKISAKWQGDKVSFPCQMRLYDSLAVKIYSNGNLPTTAAETVTKIGIIGCDTSHTIEFTEVFNMKRPDWAKGFRVTAAHKWGSKDIFSSTNRYPKYIAQMKQMGVEMCETVDELIDKVDVICLETNDGREHLWQAEKCFKAKKRVFIDKPIAEDYAHAKAIYELGKKYNAAYFSCSTLRYEDANYATRLATEKTGDKFASCIFFSPSPIEIQGTHSRYVWYGIHGFETVMTVMGRGAKSVRAYTAGLNDVVTITWNDGRTAVLKLDQHNYAYGGFAFPSKKGKPVNLAGPKGYEPMLRGAILPFFKDGIAPVDHEETLEIFAIMEAAAKSHAEGGRDVLLTEITGE